MDRATLNLKMALLAATINVNAIKQHARAIPTSVQQLMVSHASIIDKF